MWHGVYSIAPSLAISGEGKIASARNDGADR
jgi:hypothetical protein